MRSDSPPASWYEPADVLDDDHEPEPIDTEVLTVAGGVIWWSGDSLGDEGKS